MGFICPVCGEKLIDGGKSVTCRNAHLFDKAKKGYVNLLLGRDASLHGDSKSMALARYTVMEKGFYAPLQKEIVTLLKKELHEPAVIADCGCGECYYTCAVSEAFAGAEMLATDISKDVLAVAKRRNPAFLRAVASTFSLPIASGSCDAALNIFSPFAQAEFTRILKPGGVLLRVIPLEKHLWELKKAVYENPYLNAPKEPQTDAFTLVREQVCAYRKTLTGEELSTLFDMTPSVIKTAEKLKAVSALDVSFSFKILLYRKKC